MAYPGSFGRIVASGTLYGSETFAFSLSVVPNFPGATGLAPATKVAAITTALKAYLNTSATSSGAKLTLVKFNEIGANGRYTSKGSTVQQDVIPPVGGAGGNHLPAQCALVISLVTAIKRGPASRGRFYHPLPSTFPAVADGLISAVTAGAAADAAAKLINDINALWGGDWRVGVASDVGSGAFEPVTSVRVGRVVDTMRSRRINLPETYVVNTTAIT